MTEKITGTELILGKKINFKNALLIRKIKLLLYSNPGLAGHAVNWSYIPIALQRYRHPNLVMTNQFHNGLKCPCRDIWCNGHLHSIIYIPGIYAINLEIFSKFVCALHSQNFFSSWKLIMLWHPVMKSESHAHIYSIIYIPLIWKFLT